MGGMLVVNKQQGGERLAEQIVSCRKIGSFLVLLYRSKRPVVHYQQATDSMSTDITAHTHLVSGVRPMNAKVGNRKAASTQALPCANSKPGESNTTLTTQFRALMYEYTNIPRVVPPQVYLPTSFLTLSLSNSFLNSSFSARPSSNLFLAPLRSNNLASLSAFNRLSSSRNR